MSYHENTKIRLSKIKDMFNELQEENKQLLEENEKLKRENDCQQLVSYIEYQKREIKKTKRRR